MSGIIHYEVYVFQNNTWDLLGRYPTEQRVDAIEYAKTIERSERRPTKVVRELYDLNTQTFHEALVYLSEIPKAKEKKTSPYSNSVIPTLTSNAKQKQSGRKVAESITMLFLAMLFSVIVSGIVTASLLHLAVSSNFLPHNISQQFVLGTFTFFFLIVSIPTAAKWVNWNSFLQEDTQQETKDKPLYPASSHGIKFSKKELYELGRSQEETPTLLSKIMRNIFDGFDLLMGRTPFSQQLKEKKASEEAAQENEAALENTAQETTEQEKEELEENTENTDADQLPNTDEDAQEEKIPTEEKPETVVIPPELEKNYLKMTAFLSIILRVLQNKNIALNTYTRFGLELYLAGACECMCQEDSLSKDQNRLIFSGLLTLLGRTATLAEIFYYKMDEYVLEPKYLSMIESGAEGMRIYAGNPSSPELISVIQSAVDAWLNPEQKDQPSSGICTIMFTDMVSSTHLTLTLGDRLAQQLVRIHNSIVRKALQACSGSEIKHTGDGIMASFLWASNAIDAATAIQLAVQEHNRQSPTVPLEIRIGLNTGEPIVEDNDLFGATVQLASRICGQAGAGQIYVSSVVKELSAGKNYTFKPLGDFLLKGIDDPQPLYEVIWDQSKTVVSNNVVHAISQDLSEQDEKETELSKVLPEF